MVSRIIITSKNGEIMIQKVISVKIESSWRLLTDRAVVSLPRNVRDFDKRNIKEILRKGDKVEIWLGYDGVLNKEFQGYISNISANLPIELTCEDEMYILKQIPVNVSIRNATLKQLLNAVLPNYNIDALELEIGNIRFAKTTVSKVLEKLKYDFGLYSYFKSATLVCGKVYADDFGTINYNLEQNIVGSALNYKEASDISISIRAVSTLKNGEKIEVTVGDEEGEERQLSYYNINSKEELRKIANLDLRKYKVSGFEGNITTYGLPFAIHGQKANIKSNLYDDRDGTYYIESVNTSFDSSGFRRVIEIGEKV